MSGGPADESLQILVEVHHGNEFSVGIGGCETLPRTVLSEGNPDDVGGFYDRVGQDRAC